MKRMWSGVRGAVYGFRCAEFSKPVYLGLKALKRAVLGGVTGRDALSVALRAADHVYRQPGGPELLRAFHDDLRTTAPSEMPEFFPTDGIRETSPKTMERDAPTTVVAGSAGAEESTEVVILRRECSVNGERFAPGRHVVPASKAAGLRALDGGR